MPRKEPTEPILIRSDRTMGDQYEHEAYGMIAHSHLSGSVGHLVGSDLNHQHSIMLTISTATKTRNLNRDVFMPRKEFVRIEMSAQQWATFVSMPNCSGVPCTIDKRPENLFPLYQCGRVAEVNRDQLAKDEIDTAAREIVASIQEQVKNIKELLKRPNVSKKELSEYVSRLEHAASSVKTNLPFHVESHKEMMENNVQAAKSEIEAVFTDVVYRKGLTALTNDELEAPLIIKLSEVEE